MKACSQALRIFTMLCNFHPGHFITPIFNKQLFSLLSSPQLLETTNLLSVFHKFTYSEIFNKGNHTVAGCWDSFLLWLTEDQCTPHCGFSTNPSHQHTLGLLLPSVYHECCHSIILQVTKYKHLFDHLQDFFVVLGIDSNTRKALYHLAVAPAWTFAFNSFSAYT